MDPALFSALSAVLGPAALAILQKIAEKRLEKTADKALDRLAEVGKKDELVAATEKAYAVWVKAMADQLVAAGLDGEEIGVYSGSFQRFLEDDAVGEALAQAVLQIEGGNSPDLSLFRSSWKRLEGKDLPEGFRWDGALTAYGKLLQKEKFKVPALRDIATAELTAKILDEIREQRRRAGMRPETDEWRYAERMKTKYRALDLSALAPPTGEEGSGLVQLRDVFIPQDVRENPPAIELPRDLLRRLEGKKEEEGDEERARYGEREDELLRERMERMRTSYAERPREKVLDVLGRADARRIVLLGYPGSGKSTLARYVLLSVLEPPAGEPLPWLVPFAKHLPILIELREYIARRAEQVCENFLGFLDHLGKSQGYSLDQDGLDRRLRGGPSLVIFDGLDEIFEPAERERVAQEVAGFAATYSLARILVTSRPAGYKEAVLKGADFRHYALEDLDDGQVETFVSGWFALVFPDRPSEAVLRRDRIARAVKARSVRLLAGNPMLLTIMAILARHQELPRERAEFYRQAAEALCHHWDVNRHLEEVGIAADYVGLDDKKELLRRIAFRMQSAPKGLAGNFIVGEELEAEFGSYFRERYQEPPGKARKIAQALILHLRERNHVLCLYGPELYGFVHRTFLEYFCATEFVRRLEKEPGYSIERLIEEAFSRHWEDAAWQEVLRLICGMVGEAYAGKVIEFLSGPVFPDWEANVVRQPPCNLVLGVQCLSEVRNRNAIEPACLGLLQAIVESLEVGRGVWELWRLSALVKNELLDAAREVAPHWPGKEWFRARFSDRFSAFAGYGLCSEFALLAQVLFQNEESLYHELFSLFSPEKLISWNVVAAALQALATGWPQDASVRVLLEQRAVHDDEEGVRATALVELSRGWPQDAAVRELLEQRGMRDAAWSVRRTALTELSRGWPQDAGVRELLERQAVQDAAWDVRRTALLELCGGWRHDDGVRQLLEYRAAQDEAEYVRSAALIELSRAWPQDIQIRALLEYRATQDKSSEVRGTALAELCRSWQRDGGVRELVEHRAAEDKDQGVRVRALSELGRGWPQDAEVRKLLEYRATRDEDGEVRSTALSELRRGWSQEPKVREFLEHRAVQDKNRNVRGTALGELVRAAGLGRRAQVVVSLHFKAVSPFIDPLKPLSSNHVKEAASRLGYTLPELEAEITEWSKTLGWNLFEGLGKKVRRMKTSQSEVRKKG